MSKDALHYLTRVIGLCQTPHDMWTDEDRRILREAREFIQQQQEETNLESKCEEKGSSPVGPSGQGENSETTDGEV